MKIAHGAPTENVTQDEITEFETIIHSAEWVCNIASGDETVDAKNAPGISAKRVPNRRGLTMSVSCKEKDAAGNS